MENLTTILIAIVSYWVISSLIFLRINLIFWDVYRYPFKKQSRKEKAEIIWLGVLIPILRVYYAILILEYKHVRKIVRKNFFKKLSVLIIGLLFTINSNGQYNKEVAITLSPIKTGIGIIYSQDNLILSLEQSKPYVEDIRYTYLKFGAGCTLYQYIDYSYDSKFDVLVLWNEATKDFINKYSLSKLSVELGIRVIIKNNISTLLYYDILNNDARIGIGLRL